MQIDYEKKVQNWNMRCGKETVREERQWIDICDVVKNNVLGEEKQWTEI